MDNKDLITEYQRYMAPTYGPKIVPAKGKGSRVWDIEDKEYIDLGGGIAVTSVGHCHPEVVEALSEQGNKLWHLSNVYANEPAIKLAKELCENTFADKVFFCNSGGEANEAAIKLARRYSIEKYGDEKHEIISFHKAFHGRTFLTISVGGQEKYRKNFGPIPGGIKYCEYNNIEEFKKLISDKTCAVIMEPIQGEGGIIDCNPDFVQIVRDLCNENNAVLIFDEVQTGVGRTGKLFAYEHLGISPDILTSAKGLGGGIPVGAMLAKDEIAKTFVVGTHGSTYGGNPLVTAVALKVFELVNRPEVYEGVLQKRKLIEKHLDVINKKHQIFEGFRGKGLLIGLPLCEKFKGKAREFLNAGLDQGVFVLVAGLDVLRFAPSLLISDEEIEEGLKRFSLAVDQVIKNQ